MTIADLQKQLSARLMMAPNLEAQHQTDAILIGALTLIGEARGESYDGQIAVAHTFYNRATDKSRTIPAVCLEPAQYSCWWGDDENATYVRGLANALYFTRQPLGRAELRQVDTAKHLVAGVLSGALPDNTHGATHYCTQTLLWSHPPKWTIDKAPCAIIGRHAFFAGIPWN